MTIAALSHLGSIPTLHISKAIGKQKLKTKLNNNYVAKILDKIKNKLTNWNAVVVIVATLHPAASQYHRKKVINISDKLF